MDFQKLRKKRFGKRFIHIGLETSAVAAASVVEGPSPCNLKVLRNVDVYKTNAKPLISNASEAREGG